MSLIKCPDCEKEISDNSINCIFCGYTFNDNKLYLEKTVSFYSARINTWVGTRMERDKTILTLSTAGIGILVTMLTSFGIKNSFSFVFYIFSFISFLTSIIILLFVFSLNADYLLYLDDEKKIKHKKCLLKLLDKSTFVFFITGIVFTILNSFTISLIK